MGNNIKRTKRILSFTDRLPFFDIDDLSVVEKNRKYLKIMLSRFSKRGEILRLRKGLYVSAAYISNLKKDDEMFSFYSETTANNLYKPSYLSVDYVLYEHNALTEIPRVFTSMSLNKTCNFFNYLGKFHYHKIKKELFTGFNVEKKGDFYIFKATKAKALFDFLYLRKNDLNSEKEVSELRLNIDVFSEKDKKEFNNYIHMEGSKLTNNINKILWK